MDVADDVCTFRDVKPVPDIIHQYTSAIRNDKTPLVIDHGLTLFLVLKNCLYEQFDEVFFFAY